ncbi:MAG: hypothetical protein A3A86_07405 [Elusimicrobia bacterium RIFCSPLOWO2_01_FULL_60_11]|nr:MAG: hypothetical protein A3A86_07405 [Elusimicrobia bacterium RIFCSPLOWO2_01_FULL_60_11]
MLADNEIFHRLKTWHVLLAFNLKALFIISQPGGIVEKTFFSVIRIDGSFLRSLGRLCMIMSGYATHTA